VCCCGSCNEISDSIKCREFLDYGSKYEFVDDDFAYELTC